MLGVGLWLINEKYKVWSHPFLSDKMVLDLRICNSNAILFKYFPMEDVVVVIHASLFPRVFPDLFKANKKMLP